MEYRNVCCFRSRWAVAAATACVALAYLGYGRASVADEPAARPLRLWDQSGGADLNDYDADGGVGFMAVLGIDWLPAEHFALGLDVRYRYLVSDSLKYDTDGAGDGTIVQSGHLRGDGTTETYDLSFSGVSVQAMVKLVI